MSRSTSTRGLAAAIALAGALALAPAAQAAIPSIPDGANGQIACADQAAPNAGERHCSGIFTTFDGAPIDVNVGFPPAPASGPDGNFPIVGVFHGWGGSKLGLDDDLQEWLDAGYAVFSMSDRGWGNSCGGTDPKRLQPVCTNGYNHLMDTRYEVRDAQEVWEALADAGLINPQAIAATGGSYGGGISMALGALRNRQMQPDGTLVPWVSAGGKAMQIAAVQPNIPWTDLAYSLQPNGATLDYVADAPYLGPDGDRAIGVEKLSFNALLYAAGQALSNYSATDPDAQLPTWYALVNAGEPYEALGQAGDIIDELTTHHSSYYIDHSVAPAPMLITNGWTDDLFPPDEAIRFYNRTRTEHPGTPISMIFSDHGHMRGQNKSIDTDFRDSQTHAWFDYYVKHTGPEPFQGVQALTTTCPGSAPSGGATGPFDDLATDAPFRAPTWAAMAPGEVRFDSAAAQTIVPGAGSPAVGQSFDPIAGGGACATASGTDQPGVATYRLDPAPAAGYTLMGAPTVVASVAATTPTSQVAARLLDVAPNGDETLVARSLYRPTGEPKQVFQLHPNGWHFDQGHIPKLELLPADSPYGRASNGQGQVTVSDLELRLPVLESPGTGPAKSPAAKVLPPGYELAIDYRPGAGAGGGDGGGTTGGNPPGSCAATPIAGSAMDDKLRGTVGDDVIRGGRGNDRLRGGRGDDCLFANQGRDHAAGAAGDDVIRGGAGNDTLSGGAGADTINCGQGHHDVAHASSKDTVRGCERVRHG
ncbi:MAG: type transport system ATP-binding protein [Solirubrobacterales bacterium]|jgi:predicted acyl esterase|nr:type transport system ATP-binding protein [Solirubrobacterales bacterium]